MKVYRGMRRPSFQFPKPGRIYETKKTNRSGVIVRYLMAEIRTAPGKLERTGYSLAARSYDDAWQLCDAWLKPRVSKQKAAYLAAHRRWKR